MPTYNTDYPVIMVVDDDTDLREALKDIFEFSGYVVFTAATGFEGLHLLRCLESVPSLIISDVRMADMDGYQFRQAVYADSNWREIPFVFLSARNPFQDESRQRGLQVQGFMTKPFAVEDLLATVSRILHAGASYGF
jgi:CheY-like chemotaxis protein